MAGYGVRKKRPKYSDGPFLLSINDVVNAVCPSESKESDDDKSDCSTCSVFQRFCTEDGIDLSYDSSEGTLQISLRYRKLVITNESLHSLVDVGVSDAGAFHRIASNNNERISIITPGMELIDGMYVMRVQEVRSNVGEINATKVYKILDNTGRT